jgi:EAL domain-containing protein (putative c-di-GMP-specific phosphodiesterase class I)
VFDRALKPGVATAEGVHTALQAIRRHLGMEVAYVSEFVGTESVFREVDAPGLEHLIKPGDRMALDDVFCRHILEGRLPELMPDTADFPFAAEVPISKAVQIGAHMSVPIRRPDGTPFGMFCCLSPHANNSLNERDLQVMRVFAELAADQIVERNEAEKVLAAKRDAIGRILADGAFSFVYQPIWNFHRRRPAGFEALCRFSPAPYRSPDKWFADAVEVGLGLELELAVVRGAFAALDRLPADAYMSVNASPETVLDGRLLSLLADLPAERIVLEVTEHAPVADYGRMVAALAPLRASGVRLAIDDAGAGYSSLQHIVQLRPDIIKLDMSLTRSVDTDQARRALAAALIYFAAETGCVIVAEGIETKSEMETLQLLGVPNGQGYYIGRPATADAAANPLAMDHMNAA